MILAIDKRIKNLNFLKTIKKHSHISQIYFNVKSENKKTEIAQRVDLVGIFCARHDQIYYVDINQNLQV